MSLFFISDLHLVPETQTDFNEISLRFFSLLEEIASTNNTLYILGDLFDVWLRDSISLPQYVSTVNRLKTATDKGLKIFLLVGNRDFMLGRKFYQYTKIKPIKAISKLNLNDQKILLTHGDRLCIDDKNYQKMRLILQNPLSKFILTILPKNWLLSFVKKLQKNTNIDKSNKSEVIMDVNNHAVTRWMRKYKCDVLVHGHTHRPATHKQKYGTRYVLGDWQNDCQILKYDGNFKLVKYT